MDWPGQFPGNSGTNGTSSPRLDSLAQSESLTVPEATRGHALEAPDLDALLSLEATESVETDTSPTSSPASENGVIDSIEVRFSGDPPLPPLRWRLKCDILEAIPSANLSTAADGVSIVVELQGDQRQAAILTIQELLNSHGLRAAILSSESSVEALSEG
jgi:hypothetical protein